MSPRLTGNLVTVFGMALWASAFPATEVLLETWHPLLLAPARIGVASAVLLLILAARGGLHELGRVPWRDALRIGGLGIGLATI